MTDRSEFPELDGDDALAAEYVLGVLDLAERLAVERRLRSEPQLVARITDWQSRFAPLNVVYAPVRAPDLMPQIEARLFPETPKSAVISLVGRWSFLRGALVGLVIVGLAVAIVSITQPRDPEVPVIVAQVTLEADLTTETGDLVVMAAWVAETQTLSLTRLSGGDAGPGQDYEVWVIAPDTAPVSLGLFRGTEIALAADVAEGWTLAVSLEPEGGSTTGAPTGPVLAAAPFTAL